MGNVLDITQRKSTEQALVESEYRFRCLQEASFGGIAIHDNGIILDVNEALSEVSGYATEDLIGMDGLGLIAPQWRESVRAKIREGYSLAYEVEGLRKDGTVYPLEIRGKTMPYKGRKARVTEFRDITELKRTQKALEKSEERFSAALKASPQWIAISTKSEGRFLEVNQGFSTISGFTREEALGRTSVELGFWQNPRERSRIVRMLDKQGCIRNLEVRWRLNDGRIHNMLWTADPIDWDGEDCLINALTDITEFKQVQENLRASEERYRSVMEATYEPMVVYDLEGKAIYINPAFTRVFGWSADEILGRRIDFVPEEEKPRALDEIMAVLRNGYCDNYETQRMTKDGRKLDVSISAANYKDHDGNVMGMVAHLRDISRRKQDERALKVSEARFKHMVELAGDWFWEMGADLRFTELSPKFFAMAHIKPEDIVGKTRWGFASPERILCEPRKWEAHIEDMKAHRPFHNFVYGFLTKGRRPFYMSISGVPLFGDEGEFLGYRGSGTEITERVLAQQALQKAHDELEEKVAERTAELEESRRNFMQAFHESPAWMCITDMETGRFIEVNGAYSNGLGRTREELIGRTTLEAAIWPSPEVRKKWAQAVRAGAKSGSPSVMEVELLHKDGTVRTVTGTVGVMHWGGKQVFVSNAVDVTEQKKAQAALRESEEQYRTILDNTGTATIIVDEKASITYANPEIRRLLGYSPEDIVGKKKWTELVHQDDVERMLQYARFRREPGQLAPRNYEFRMIHRSGAIKNVYHTTAMIPGTNSNVSSMTDITELKQAQEEIRRHRDRLEEMVGERTRELSAALNEKEILLREIHHRVKNNMAVVSSLLNLQANKVNDLGVQMALQESQNRVQAMALIHETLYQSDSLAEVDLQHYVDRLLANLVSIFEGRLGRITFHVDAGGIKLEASKAVPCGLIINELITNALKYAFPAGGEGRVSINARLLASGEAELVVSDNGAGFPPGIDQSKAKSLGLRLIGLMVEQLRGQWEVGNNEGARVTIRCPLKNH